MIRPRLENLSINLFGGGELPVAMTPDRPSEQLRKGIRPDWQRSIHMRDQRLGLSSSGSA